MPAEGIHLTSLREAVAAARLPAAARACTTRHEAEARLGAIALDLPYFDRYLEEVARYALGWKPRASDLGAIVHERAAVDIAVAVLEAARARRSDRLAAVGLRLVSHCAMDRQLHPLVNALARAFPDGRSHDAAHREVEKLQSILFHEAYFGREIMGARVVVRLVEVPIREIFRGPEVLETLAAAFRGACNLHIPGATLARMGRGYEQHAVLLGSPLGRRVTDAAEKARARPRFLEGAWGRFEDVLGRAVEGSLAPLERAWAFYEAEAAEAEAARAALLDALPPGSIDPPGEDVDLARPFVPRLA